MSMSVLYFALFLFSFFFNDPATTEIYTLSLHDALPICRIAGPARRAAARRARAGRRNRLPARPFLSAVRSEEHTSELQSLRHLVCRLLLEKKKKKDITELCYAQYLTKNVLTSHSSLCTS